MAGQGSSKWSWFWAAVAVMAIAVAGYLYLNPRKEVVWGKETYFIPKPVPGAERIKKIYVPCPETGVVTLDKGAVAEKLGMPWLRSDEGSQGTETTEGTEGAQGTETAAGAESTAGADEETAGNVDQDDEGQPAHVYDLAVTATAELPESANGYDAFALFNTKTGDSQLMARQKESPWLEFRNKMGVGIRYGVGIGEGQPLYTGTVYGFWEFMRVKDVFFTGYGEVNTDGVGKIQADMQWRRR